MKIELELTEKEFQDLKTIVELVYDQFDFHGDLIPMQRPLDKLALALGFSEDWIK